MDNIASLIFLVIALLLVSLLSSSGARSSWIPLAHSPCDFQAIYNFGDSNSDTGATSAAFWPTPPPYGVNYFGRPAGRYSDGRLIIDFIAEHLGMPYLSSYLDSIGTNFRHGANFASAGSSIRRQNESMFENGLSPFSLDIQTIQFYQFKSRTNELYNQAVRFNRSELPRPRDFSRALYTFDIGQNDLVTGFRKLTMPQLRAAIPNIIDQFAAALIRLYEQGARAFWIHNTGPIGCLPLATMLYGQNRQPGFYDKYGCITTHNAMAVEFNKQLKARVASLRAQLPRAAFIYVDVYSAKYHLITNSKSYGFKDPLRICCGHHTKNVHVGCGERVAINGSMVFGGAHGSPTACISWDGVHYSQAANHWIANHILYGAYSDPPMPISRACLNR